MDEVEFDSRHSYKVILLKKFKYKESKVARINSLHPIRSYFLSFFVVSESLTMRHIVFKLSFICYGVVVVVNHSLSLLFAFNIISFVTQSIAVLIDAFALLGAVDEISSVGAIRLC